MIKSRVCFFGHYSWPLVSQQQPTVSTSHGASPQAGCCKNAWMSLQAWQLQRHSWTVATQPTQVCSLGLGHEKDSFSGKRSVALTEMAKTAVIRIKLARRCIVPPMTIEA